MKVAALLLALAAAANLLPDLVARLSGQSRAAWDYVGTGAQLAALWSVLFAACRSFPAQAVAAWGIFEALQRPACRLAFPMDAPVKLPEGKNLCDAAFGLPMTELSILAALLLAALMQEVLRVVARPR